MARVQYGLVGMSSSRATMTKIPRNNRTNSILVKITIFRERAESFEYGKSELKDHRAPMIRKLRCPSDYWCQVESRTLQPAKFNVYRLLCYDQSRIRHLSCVGFDHHPVLDASDQLISSLQSVAHPADCAYQTLLFPVDRRCADFE